MAGRHDGEAGDELKIGRRTTLKGGAAVLAAVGLSGFAANAAAAPKTDKSNNSGSVDGTVIEPAKVLVNSPENLAAVEANLGREFAAVFKHGPLALQIDDDTAQHGTQTGYSNAIQFLTQGGARIGTINGDVSEHIGFYTATTDVTATGTDAQPAKRMNIQGGDDFSEFDFYDNAEFAVRGYAADATQDNLLSLYSNPGQDNTISMHEGGTTHHSIKWDASDGLIKYQAPQAPTQVGYQRIDAATQTIDWPTDWEHTGGVRGHTDANLHLPSTRLEAAGGDDTIRTSIAVPPGETFCLWGHGTVDASGNAPTNVTLSVKSGDLTGTTTTEYSNAIPPTWTDSTAAYATVTGPTTVHVGVTNTDTVPKENVSFRAAYTVE